METDGERGAPPGAPSKSLNKSSNANDTTSEAAACKRERRRGELERFHRAAGGVVECVIVDRAQQPALIASAFAGNARSIGALRALARWLDGRALDEPLCMNRRCAVEFGASIDPAAFVIVLPYLGEMSHCLISAVCAACRSAHDDAAILGWLKALWPDGRVIDAPRGSGRA